jgi:hypothetical protein
METRNRSYLEAAKSTPEEVQARKKAAEERKRVREARVEQPQNTAQEKPVEENVDNTVETGGVKQKQKRRKLAKEAHSIDENPAATAVVDLTTVDTMEVDTAVADDTKVEAISPSAGDAKILAGAEDAGGRDPSSNKRRTRYLRVGGRFLLCGSNVRFWFASIQLYIRGIR